MAIDDYHRTNRALFSQGGFLAVQAPTDDVLLKTIERLTGELADAQGEAERLATDRDWWREYGLRNRKHAMVVEVDGKRYMPE